MNRLIILILNRLIILMLLFSTRFIALADVPADSLPAMPTDSLTAPMPTPTPRKVSPVDIDDKRREPVMHYFDKHGEPLEEPVLFLASLDTVAKPKAKPVYPAYNGLSVGVNFGDALMMAFGQKFASFDVWADVSLWNWLFPVVEAGFGYARTSPENHNFTYRVKPSFFCKVGFNYNFLYKSKPDYQLYVGFRAGFSNFGWEVTDVTIDNSYWQDSTGFDMTGMRSTAWWGEAVAGIKVKIVSRFSLGWNIRWHFPFKVTAAHASGLPGNLDDSATSKPWFIPGYGGSLPFSFALSAIWTF